MCHSYFEQDSDGEMKRAKRVRKRHRAEKSKVSGRKQGFVAIILLGANKQHHLQRVAWSSGV